MYKIKSQKKAIGPVIAAALLILVAVVSIVGFQSWFNDYSSGTFSKVETQSSDSVTATGIELVKDSIVYFRNSGSKNITITSIKIGNKTCTTSSANVSSNSVKEFDVTGCITDENLNKREVTVFTDKRIFSEYYLIKGVLNGSFYSSFSSGGCSVSTGYVNIFGLSALSNAHAEPPTGSAFTYNLCVKSPDYSLGTSCSGNFERLFYLGNSSSSHIWIDNSTAYNSTPNYYTWTPVCISTSSGIANLTLTYSSTDMTSSGYTCINSFIQNDTYGGVVGDCNAHTNKTWFKVS